MELQFCRGVGAGPHGPRHGRDPVSLRGPCAGLDRRSRTRGPTSGGMTRAVLVHCNLRLATQPRGALHRMGFETG